MKNAIDIKVLAARFDRIHRKCTAMPLFENIPAYDIYPISDIQFDELFDIQAFHIPCTCTYRCDLVKQLGARFWQQEFHSKVLQTNRMCNRFFWHCAHENSTIFNLNPHWLKFSCSFTFVRIESIYYIGCVRQCAWTHTERERTQYNWTNKRDNIQPTRSLLVTLIRLVCFASNSETFFVNRFFSFFLKN